MKKLSVRLSSVLLVLLMAVGFSGCRMRTGDFDVTGYIQAVLKCSYLDETDDYVTFTSATEEEISDYQKVTVNNAAVRFFTKYEMNASDEQIEKMEAVLTKAYANSKFTVEAKTETSSGYNVVVDYDIQTTFMNLEDDIVTKRAVAQSEGTATTVGAAYIDNVIEFCDNSISEPTYDGNSTTEFEIRIDNDDNLSLNINLFDKIDEEILPF